ncbi:SAM-dependent methyltransferase [Streptosporangium canum]|uniref:SAM-dependent methyltransferase n=1 Tax=Streptosporangium canum TaxID=324952 RepID=UPI0036915698
MTHRPELAGELTGIGATALGVAFLRAEESRRADRLFDDPYARTFLDADGAAGSVWTAAPASTGPGFAEMMADQVAVRTRFLDRALLEAAGAGCAQVVLLACGLDTRAFRLDWPAGTRVFEVDFADVLAFRGACLAGHGVLARCDRVEVPADLRDDWPGALVEAGLRPHLPTAWLAEGILYALPADAADLLLDRVTGASAPGSVLALDHMEDSEPLRAARRAISTELVDLWRGGPAGDLASWLRGRGWRPALRDLGEVAAGYRRPVPPAFDPERAGTGRGWLVTAHLAEDRR